MCSVILSIFIYILIALVNQNLLYMRMRRIVFIFCRLACVFILPAAAFGQPAVPDSIAHAAALENAVSTYRDYLGNAASFYAGTRYTDYHLQLKSGHPFFKGLGAYKGEIMFEGILYPNLLLKYDMLIDRVILIDSARLLSTSLNADKIDYFTMDGHRFVKFFKTKSNELPATDFYEVLQEGKGFTLIKKDDRRITEDSEHKRDVRSVVSYYLKKGDVYHPFNNQRQVLAILDDKKAEVRNYIKKKDLAFKENADDTLRSILSYYESLLK